MMPLDQVLALCGIGRDELTLWIERRWVMPLAADGDFLFDEADLARVRMIAEFRNDLALDDEALPAVLGLVDQLHATRRRFRHLVQIICELPEEQCEAILRRLDGPPERPPET
jgi:chaperone modulatory protein CbpM